MQNADRGNTSFVDINVNYALAEWFSFLRPNIGRLEVTNVFQKVGGAFDTKRREHCVVIRC